MSEEVLMLEKRNCDICGKLARYDGRTTGGSWAYMCEECFIEHGVGLGTGKGQKLIYKEEQLPNALKSNIESMPESKENLEDIISEQNKHYNSIKSYINDDMPSKKEIETTERVLKYCSEINTVFSKDDSLLVMGCTTNILKWMSK